MTEHNNPFQGQRWLVEERDACGVGFLAYPDGRQSHQLVQNALTGLTCMEHRGACSADQDSGDGAGIMTGLPVKLLEKWFAQQHLSLPEKETWAVGMIFLPPNEPETSQAKIDVENAVKSCNLTVLGWREVPVNTEVLGQQARENQPYIAQIIVTAPDGMKGDQLDRTLYIARSLVGKKLSDTFYICSFSCRTIVYKGMVRSSVLGEFYNDLQNPDYESSFAIYHRRFSTNTMPKWPFAQPMRLLGHNGEINTLLGNINWMNARENSLSLEGWTEEELKALSPIVNTNNSDSYNLDSAFELLIRTGRSVVEALMILVPEAYQNQPDLKNYPEITDFYNFYSGLQEPWDGPALLVFSDGKIVGATLDRNGLRPARYVITNDGLISVASEAGVFPIAEETIIEKGRLGPGQMITVDLETQEILKNWEIKQRIAKAKPYGAWVQQYQKTITPQTFQETPTYTPETLLRLQTAFGYNAEDVSMIIEPMATTGKEPTFCMGEDIPLPILSEKPRLLYDYFKQRFAQVTNPPIDPLRESLVMSLNMYLGERGNLLEITPESGKLVKLETPVLNDTELQLIRKSGYKATDLSTLYNITDGPSSLEKALDTLCENAANAVKNGAKILILTDRPQNQSLSDTQSYIPPLLAVGAVHHHLIRQGLRLQTSLIADTAQCWSTHHYACLVGYGASAVCPYLTLDSLRNWWYDEKTQKLMANGKLPQISLQNALKSYRKAVEAGILKILSKMGISLLSSYHGAQIFEAIGLGMELVDRAFFGTTSRVGGLNIAELAQETINFHSLAFPELKGKKLENYGFINYKPGGEYHTNSPDMAKRLHKAIAAYNTNQAVDFYELYRQYIEDRPVTALRDLLTFKSDRESIPLEEVESIEHIVKRFCTGGMSLGALSREAHETLAIAMNRLGAKSNSGEGGEDPLRFHPLSDVDEKGHSTSFPHLKGLRNGDIMSSAIKQIASGRFGVTPEYLMSAEQLEIKVAQGAKPGEGGQLPGKKVSPYIAMLRRSKPGVDLISPPPHHDIYSIEDLAQLIYDLHQINPKAKVSVKLVAEIGIGTVAAGVAKANADIIQISGHDGGTGASPLSSIKHAGGPWELGVSEVHRVLMENKLRDRILLRADGGLRTGWDVMMAALMGAEEYGFGAVAMIAEGCIMARVCHTNNCPVGVATQQEKLRQRFTGVPGDVVNFFYYVAEEVRVILARLGYRSLQEIIGRADLLEPRAVSLRKTSSLNLDCLTQLPDSKVDRTWLEHGDVHGNGDVLDDQILANTTIQEALETQGTTSQDFTIVNTDRSVGARLAGVIAQKYGDTGFAGEITLNFTGSAGQSFGAFNIHGVKLVLHGESNDYVGKGMNGGEIIIKPLAKSSFKASENVIVGNTCLYGATGGVLYANGRAGERFGVRNSFGKAVIEGAGDHCCEYMTGGVIVVLGSVGRNMGAGMTGGLAYILDEDNSFLEKYNREIVKPQRVESPVGIVQLKELISSHFDRTGSQKAQEILNHWETYLPKFWQVVPPSEANSPEVKLEEKAPVTVKS